MVDGAAESTVKPQTRFLEDPGEIKSQIVDQFDMFLCDMDGVIWEGSYVIPGVIEAVASLSQNKTFFWVTNNSAKTRKGYQEVLKARGFGHIPQENIYCTAYAMAKYLKMIGFKGRAFMIANDAMREELKLLDVDLHEATTAGEEKPLMPAEFADEPIDSDVQAVIVGCDPSVSYYRLCYASSILQANSRCLFLATNKDLWVSSNERRIPGTGTFVGVLETTSKRMPVVVGKPSGFILDDIIREYGIDRSRVCMIGDNLLTDIAFGIENGISTILVETGVHRRADIGKTGLDVFPNFVIPSLAKLHGG